MKLNAAWNKTGTFKPRHLPGDVVLGYLTDEHRRGTAGVPVLVDVQDTVIKPEQVRGIAIGIYVETGIDEPIKQFVQAGRDAGYELRLLDATQWPPQQVNLDIRIAPGTE